MAMTLEFDTGPERPAYIGLANTLIAPSTILAPLIGGWLADSAGYSTTFFVSVLGSLATVVVLSAMLRDPRLPDRTSQSAISAE
jgi:predicted MFS family arabinose efflux permease